MKIFSIFKSLIFFLLIIFSTYTPASIFTTWTENPSDPLAFPFTASVIEDYYPSTIYDKSSFSGHGVSALYKMWYQGGTLAQSNIAYATSTDGINWTQQSDGVFGAPVGKFEHVVVIYDANGFGGGPFYYKMWFWTGVISNFPPALGIMSASSVDGLTWTVPVANTQDATQFLADTSSTAHQFYQFYGFATVIYNPNATSTPGEPFSYPYAVFFDSADRQAVFHYQEAVGLAYSSDGVNWFRNGTTPVLVPSTNVADWDGMYEYRASVLKLAKDGMYHMYFTGSNGSTFGGTALSYAHGIGHAMSADGINWTKDSANPIFLVTDGVAWRSNHIVASSVVEVLSPASQCVDTLQMWFGGGNASNNMRMGFATACVSQKPEPPSSFTGVVTVNRFLDRTVCVLNARWNISPSANITAYRIYHNGRLTKSIPSTAARVFNTQVANCSLGVYQIAAVNDISLESTPVRLRVVQ